MPKKVDKALQKQKIAHAVWSLIGKKGMHQLSVRNVAVEASLPTSSLRYYFPVQEDLLFFSLELSVQSFLESCIPVDSKALTFDEFLLVLKQFLPLTKKSESECRVWFAFLSYQMPNKNNDICSELQLRMRNYLQQQLLRFLPQISFEQSENEAILLHALLDGLALSYFATMDQKNVSNMIDFLSEYLQQLERRYLS